MFEAIDINCDVGEGYGNYTFGSDEEIMPYLSSANIACGFHGGDPIHMERTIKLAKEHGVAIGAHWGLPDVLGFGRRRMDISAADARCICLYQVGALRGVAGSQDMDIDHLGPHGVLDAMLGKEEELAQATVNAIKKLNKNKDWAVYWSTPAKDNIFMDMLQMEGFRVVPEIIADLEYNADGSVIIERSKKPTDVEAMGRRLEQFLTTGKLPAIDGSEIEFDVKAILFHGDGPNALEVAKKIRGIVDNLGIKVVPASQLV